MICYHPQGHTWPGSEGVAMDTLQSFVNELTSICHHIFTYTDHNFLTDHYHLGFGAKFTQ